MFLETEVAKWMVDLCGLLFFGWKHTLDSYKEIFVYLSSVEKHSIMISFAVANGVGDSRFKTHFTYRIQIVLKAYYPGIQYIFHLD